MYVSVNVIFTLVYVFQLSYIGGRRVTNDRKLILNIEVLLDDLRLLGKGLIRNIEQKV